MYSSNLECLLIFTLVFQYICVMVVSIFLIAYYMLMIHICLLRLRAPVFVDENVSG